MKWDALPSTFDAIGDPDIMDLGRWENKNDVKVTVGCQEEKSGSLFVFYNTGADSFSTMPNATSIVIDVNQAFQSSNWTWKNRE